MNEIWKRHVTSWEPLLREPQVKALWFVDRGAEYFRFMNELRRQELNLPFPVYYWNSQQSTIEEIRAAPTFTNTPGIWLEMKNAPDQLLLYRVNELLTALKDMTNNVAKLGV